MIYILYGVKVSEENQGALGMGARGKEQMENQGDNQTI